MNETEKVSENRVPYLQALLTETLRSCHEYQAQTSKQLDDLVSELSN